MNTRKISVGGLMIALSVLLPQIFHLIAGVQAGKMFLPMHIPVLLSGFILGPAFGVVIGATAPIINTLITGMPPMARLPFMIIELAGYGFASGAMYKLLYLCNIKYKTVLSLIIAMIFGRILYALTLFAAADLLRIAAFGAVEALRATAAGAYGIILQIFIIPTLVYSLKRFGYYDLLVKKSRKNAT